MRFVSIGVALSVVGCIGAAAPGVEGDATTSEPDVAEEVASCPTDQCKANGACHGDGDVNPQNVCEVCDVTRDRNDWSPALGDKTCDDGDNCTGAGTCRAGVCTRGEPTEACDVTAECVERCDDQCNLVITERTCFIDGVCYAAGEAGPGDDCRTCQPGRSQTQWSGTNVGCDDGDPCTYEDSCTNTGCVGVLNTCDDGRDCTADFCDGGVCQHPITDGCLVATGCVEEGASPPGSPCFVCTPEVSRTTLSIAEDAPCDDADVCTTSSTCRGDGQCSGSVASVDVEPNDTLANARDLGIADGSEFPEGESSGNLLTRNDVDVYRWGMPFDVNGVVFSPRATITTVPDMDVELCVYATCGQSSQTASPPTLVCPTNTDKDDLGTNTLGCCREVRDGQGSVQLNALCVGLTNGFGYAQVKALGEIDADSCGGYDLKWGIGR